MSDFAGLRKSHSFLDIAQWIADNFKDLASSKLGKTADIDHVIFSRINRLERNGTMTWDGMVEITSTLESVREVEDIFRGSGIDLSIRYSNHIGKWNGEKMFCHSFRFVMFAEDFYQMGVLEKLMDEV